MPAPTARVSPDDIPTEITRMTYSTTQALSEAGVPVLSQKQTAVFLAQYWPAIEQHIGAQVRAAAFAEAADLIDTTSLARLDAIDEDDRNPSDWDRHQEWLDAADVLRAADAPVIPGGE